MDYRNQSRQHLRSAKDELATNADDRLKFASLELRMAMECLTYDRALAYKDEFPPSEYETWQPRKVMTVLLEIDPMADQRSTIAIGLEDAPGVPASEMQSLGSETVLSMGMIRKHYDALGSYLHVQSMKHARGGVPLDFRRMRARCDEIAKFVEEVLASPVFNVTFGDFAELDCVGCRKRIRKRLPFGQKQVEANCHECKASYTVVADGDDKVLWKPHQQEVRCANLKCDGSILFWKRELEVGLTWKCKACQGRNVLGLCVSFAEDDQQQA